MKSLLISIFRRPESMTFLLLLVALAAAISSRFLDAAYLLDVSSIYMETGVMALAMTLVIISGNIDLSVASGLALVCVCAAKMHVDYHIPMGLVIPLALLLGALLGLFNGLLITKLKLPSLTVTLGTLALYRGIAQRLAGDESIAGFPKWFTGLDYRKIGLVPYPLIIFLALAVVFALVLHKTVFGRCVYAIGTNEAAARFSGLRVDRIKLSIFVTSGLMMGAGALMMMSRLANSKYNHAQGAELAVITAVVLGGADIFGGRGSIAGAVLAVCLLAIVDQAMELRTMPADNQLAVTGSLLVVAVILANLSGKLGSRVRTKLPGPDRTGGEAVHA